ncbi:MAG: PBP1A family penicillin-binding protein [bacterium]|nr:PBP1A family penicillin-binding protein [bacterium]MDY2830411.1 PBP1A family penicillin-binding protein [Alphaproteobacteria bacterium]
MTKKNTTKRTKKSRRSSKRAGKFYLVLKICGIGFALLVFYLGFCLITLPDMDAAINRTRLPSTTILAENGNEVQSFGTVYSEIIRSEELPQYVIDAIVWTEDRRFYEHFGFDVVSFTRAMITNLFAGRFAQGGSTLTQQVAKNLFLTNKKTINRKTQELLLAFWLEHKFTKEQILTLYLNRVYFGNGAYGIEAASQKYFQKTSRDLNILEAAVLAGMLKAPSRYNPIASKTRALERAKVVLNIMRENNLLSNKDYLRALEMPLGDEKPSKVKNGAYFADFALSEISARIGEQESDIYALTTLDQDLQEKASAILQKEIAAAKDKNVSQGAVVILDKNGAVRALVGGVNYNQSQFNRAVQALRQPGSAFKFFVYLTAIHQGLTPKDIIEDKPLIIKDWRPENHDKKYYGEVALREAFAKSLNLAAIRLAQKVGVKQIAQLAKKLGISTPLENDLSLALGTSSVRVIDMAAAYATVANGGFAVFPYSVEEIYTNDGFQLYQRDSDENRRLLSEEETILMKKLMREVLKTGTGRSAALGREAFGKTGTSQDHRDAWFVGFDDNLICAVWIGNDDNSPMKGVYGSGLPAKIWKKIMQ